MSVRGHMWVVPFLLLGAAPGPGASPGGEPQLLNSGALLPTRASPARDRPAAAGPSFQALDRANPVRPLPAIPLGLEGKLGPEVTEQKVRLGRWLFHDKRLSADDTVSCASCHRAVAGFGDRVARSRGVEGRTGKRSTPAIVNVGLAPGRLQFWDGRASTLEEQALLSMQNPNEMALEPETAAQKIRAVAGYGRFFELSFGDPAVTIDRIAQAIACYVRTRLSGNSRWDRWKAGDAGALSEAARQGEGLFFGKARCSVCHVPPLFTDGRFHNLGVGWSDKEKDFEDAGRGEITGVEEEAGAFKTPGLREVSRHPPYMHDGSLSTLEDVVEFYRLGCNTNPRLDRAIEPLELSDAEVEALVAFLKALDGEGFEDEGPAQFPG